MTKENDVMIRLNDSMIARELENNMNVLEEIRYDMERRQQPFSAFNIVLLNRTISNLKALIKCINETSE
jgi:hypothetical protein